METKEFEVAIQRVLERAAAERIVLMCAELHPTTCHRSLISDYLTLNGQSVIHLVEKTRKWSTKSTLTHGLPISP